MNYLFFLFKKQNILLILCICFSAFASAENINIIQYGAKGDGVTVNTKMIQKAVDDCAATGGGRVIIPAGTFLSGTINLKSKVNLHLEQGAILQGSNQISDYQAKDGTPALILAVNLHNVSVTGSGIIDGNGKDKNFQRGEGAPNRPMILLFVDCKKVTVKDIALRNPAFWTQKYLGCDGVLVDGISVYAHSNWNNDAIDIDSKNVIVSNCIFDSNDDAICLKSENKTPCENVTITNCIVASNCNGIKFGTASYGGFININITNCVIRRASEDNIWKWQERLKNITSSNTVISGIALESVDGGTIDHVNISDITMKDVQTPIFIRLGSRHMPTGSLQNVNISNIIATSESSMSNLISGVPGHNVKNVVIHDVMLINHSKGPLVDRLDKIPENLKGYPENRMFGQELPASGFYIRHAENIKLKDISLLVASREQRPFLVADDVKGLQVDDAGMARTDGTVFSTIYRLRNVSHAAITPPFLLPDYNTLMHVEGVETKDIRLYRKEEIERSKLISFSSEVKDKDVLTVFP